VHTRICLSLNFYHGVFTKRYDDSISPKLSYCIVEIFHSITELDPSFSPRIFGE
jgi:hypothetical protein